MKKFTSLMIAASLLVPGVGVAKEARQSMMLAGQEMAPQKRGQKVYANRSNICESMAGIRKAAKKTNRKVAGSDPIYEAPEGKVVNYVREGLAYYTFWGYVIDAQYENIATEVVECENGDVYLKNIITQYVTNTYIKGSKEGSTYVFDLPQTIYTEDYFGEIYVYDLNLLQYYAEDPELGGWFFTANSEEAAEMGLPEIENKLVINLGEDGTMTYDPNPEVIVGMTMEDSWVGYAEINSYWTVLDESLPTPPEGLVTTEMAMIDGTDGHFAQVGFNDDEVWVKGFFSEAPNAWIVGSLDGGKVSFKSGQFLGSDDSYGYYTYFVAAESSIEWSDEYQQEVEYLNYRDALVFDYDADTQSFTTGENSYAAYNIDKNEVYFISCYKSPTIEKQPANISKVPANPSDLVFYSDEYYTYLTFVLPMLNIDGELLHSENLYYKVFVDGDEFTFYPDEYECIYEDLTLVPYSFTDNWDISVSGSAHTVYFYFEGMDELGVQLYYYEDGEEVAASDLVTLNLESSGVENMSTESQILSERFFNVNGQEVSNPSNGIYIKTVKYSDGTSRVFKVVKK